MSMLPADAWLSTHRDLEFHDEDGRRVYVPALRFADWGRRTFQDQHQLRYPYMAGAMAHGIASVDLVRALAREGMLAAYGAAGLHLDQVERAIGELQKSLGDLTFAVNFIHTPQEPLVEERLCDLLLAKNVRLVEASAFMKMSKALVRYRVKGLWRDGEGRIQSAQRIIAKVSRVEVAKPFWSPPPLNLLDELLREGAISPLEHELGQKIPVAEDLTVEADSGGHTDNRPLVALLPQMLALKAEQEKTYGFRLRVGAAGGLGTPHAVLAAFMMGASYVVTGSINQACVEAGTSEDVRRMLAETQQGDMTMAPAADMFEMGVKLQVLKRGTMFPMRAQKLYDYYRQYPSLDAIPEKERAQLEETFFRMPLSGAWAETMRFFERRDPTQIALAERNPKHKMALVFRSYLGQSSHWATEGASERRMDYQVWCGPAMAAFNDWVRGSPLDPIAERRAALVAWNLLHGAERLYRIRSLEAQGQLIRDQESILRPLSEEALRTEAGMG